MSSKLNAESIFSAGNKQALLNQTVRPQNIIRFFEKALKAIKS